MKTSSSKPISLNLFSQIMLLINKAREENKSDEFITTSIITLMELEGVSLLRNGDIDYSQIEKNYEAAKLFLTQCGARF